MENKKRALGRGLEQLFNDENLDLRGIEERIYETASIDEIVELPISEIRSNPYQPRVNFSEESIKELASSIKEHGVFQPIIVKKSIKGFELVAGERRVRACKLLNIEKIPAIIRNFNDEQMMEIGLLENLQREDLTAIEEAHAYKNLLDRLKITQDQLSERVGKSRSHVTNILGLLRLPSEVQKAIADKKITMGHARVLSKLEDVEEIKRISTEIVNKSLSVREIEDKINVGKYQKSVKINRKKKEYGLVEELLMQKLDSKVRIKEKKIVISFENDADLNRILEILDVKEWFLCKKNIN